MLKRMRTVFSAVGGAALVLLVAYLAYIGGTTLVTPAQAPPATPVALAAPSGAHPESFAGIADAVKPAVVNVATLQPVAGAGPRGLNPFREYEARAVGRDPATDLALLKLNGSGQFPAARLADSQALRVCDWVLAIGSPFGLEQTVTAGIVSAKGRAIGAGPYDDFIQTDAAINPGNSGGPLLNARGQAIGINTAIFSQSGGSVGIGFAIPMTLAKSVVTQLADSGKVTRGWLGVGIQPVTPDLAKSFGRAETSGVLVSSVSDGSPAERAGLKPGDIITEYDGRKVERASDPPRAVAGTPVGREVRLSVIRDGKPVTLSARIAALDAKEAAQAEGGEKAKPALGLAVQPLTPALAQQLGVRATQGLVVQNVQEGSPAADAGFERGDVIVEVDKKPIKSVSEL